MRYVPGKELNKSQALRQRETGTLRLCDWNRVVWVEELRMEW